MNLTFEYNSATTSAALVPAGRTYRVTAGDRTVEVEVLQNREGSLELLIDGKRVTAVVSAENARRWVTVHGQTFVLTKSSGAGKGRRGSHQRAGAQDLTAPMPGQIRAVHVGEGDAVTKGQTLLVLEAMKMEIRIHAPQDGLVKKLLVKQGQTVEREQTLLMLEAGSSSVPPSTLR